MDDSGHLQEVHGDHVAFSYQNFTKTTQLDAKDLKHEATENCVERLVRKGPRRVT